MRRNNCELRTLLTGFPDDITGLDSTLLCELVFGQYDAMPFLSAAADRNVFAPQFRMQHTLNTGIAIVQITMKDNSLHNAQLLVERI